MEVHSRNLLQDLTCARLRLFLTAPHSRERQDLLANASTSGSRFNTTGGEFLNLRQLIHYRREKTTQWGIGDLKNQEVTSRDSEDK